MLDTERIKEAESNMRKYFEDNLISKSSPNQIVLATYLRNALESMEVAELILEKKKSDLWVVVCSYYGMYYIANAVLNKLGYKVGEKISHKVTSDALIVFVRNKLKKSLLEQYENLKEDALALVQNKTDELVLSFHYEREKRSLFQYNMKEELKSSKSQTSLTRAKEFIDEMKNLLETIK
jgi:uncharacterized protein (UPF0332 family)